MWPKSKLEYFRLDFSKSKIESIGLDLHAYVDSLSISNAAAMRKLSKLYSIYNSKIESIGLELLDTKIISEVC